MPNVAQKSHITRETVTTVLLAFLFVIAYFLVLVYTYTSLLDSAESDMLKSTTNAASSLSRTIEADSAQMDALATSLSNQAYFAINQAIFTSSDTSTINVVELVTNYLAESKPDDCIMLSYFFMDGSFVSSTGQSGNISSIEDFEKSIEGSPLFVTNVASQVSKDYVHFYREVEINGNKAGYLVGTYNYNKTLSESYSSTTKENNLENFLIASDGTLVLNSAAEGDEFYTIENLFTFLKENKYDGNLPSDGEYIKSACVNTFITDTGKYAITISPVEDYEGLYVARVMPSTSLFATTGKLIAFMTLASLLFFFILVIIAYRYYKVMVSSSNKIKNIAYTDPLTGYSNFAKFKEDTAKMLKEEADHTHYMCCIDMIGFRYINDAFGYDVGDEILIEISKEIDDLTTDDELFCRITADKFVILSERDFSDTDTNMFLYQLADRISSIKPLAKSHIRLEVQMGVYRITPEDLEDLSVNALYDRALIALYSIEHTDSAVALYDVSIYNEQLERKDIESRMHQALSDGEFRVYVQPKYRTSNAKLAAGEALIRWIDPEKGIVPPIKFIPLFEQNRFVHDVDLYVMEVVARFQRMRLNEGLPVVPISLNISPVEITMPGFLDSYISIKEKYDIPDKLIELEFTEGIFFDNETLFKDTITAFHNAGFTCSMDDFGSGYSSLNILKDLPVDTLKLDKLFFRESDNTSRDRSIIRSVVAMARSLNIKTVAEGVETLEVVDFLKLIGCTLIQGYIYSKPLPLTEFEEKLDNENIDTDDEFELDFDKFEVVPLDMPLTNSLDDSLRRTYAAIVEINAGGNIYHMYYPGESDVKFDKIPERGFYAAFIKDLAPKYVHPKDLPDVEKALNTMNLNNHFKTNQDLDIEYRHMRKDGSYSWMKLHIIKASGGRSDSQIFFGYFNIIDDYKETEESLSVAQNRFSAAYSNFNGVVFELTLSTGKVDLLETHSNILGALSEVHELDKIVGFANELLVHPDNKVQVANMCNVPYLKDYFANKDNPPLVIEARAKPSRKVTRYNYYRVEFSAQADPDKILLTIEDITAEKVAQASSELRHHITDVAFANIYEKIIIVNLDKDLYTTAVYPAGGRRKANVSEGKYSLHWENVFNNLIKEEDKNTVGQVLSIEGLERFYNDSTTSEFKIVFQEKQSETSRRYEWTEALLVSTPETYGVDRMVYVFKRSIDEMRVAEQNLNEYAHRLSYSLAMFDYAYSVEIDSESVEIIGGLKFDNEILDAEDLDYLKVTTMVKNSEIAEEDQAAFRRFTYLDELTEYFSKNPATITKIFKGLEGENKLVEVTVIYGSRERKITLFIRQIDKNLLIGNTEA